MELWNTGSSWQVIEGPIIWSHFAWTSSAYVPQTVITWHTTKSETIACSLNSSHHSCRKLAVEVHNFNFSEHRLWALSTRFGWYLQLLTKVFGILELLLPPKLWVFIYFNENFSSWGIQLSDYQYMEKLSQHICFILLLPLSHNTWCDNSNHFSSTIKWTQSQVTSKYYTVQWSVLPLVPDHKVEATWTWICLESWMNIFCSRKIERSGQAALHNRPFMATWTWYLNFPFFFFF